MPIKRRIKREGGRGKATLFRLRRNMKFAVALVFTVLSVVGTSQAEMKLPQEIIDLLMNLSVSCKEETGVEQSLVDELRKANLPEDPKAKCYLKCMMMKLQTMQEDGQLDVELIEASMPEVLKSHGGMETVHKCKHIHDPDLCEAAFQILSCFKKENPGLAAMFE